MLPTLPRSGLGLVPLPVVDVLDIEVVISIGSLEPGTAVVQVEVHGIGWRKAIVDAVEYVLFVALIVENGELGRIEKAAGIEAIALDEVAPIFAAVGEIEAAGRGAKDPYDA